MKSSERWKVGMVQEQEERFSTRHDRKRESCANTDRVLRVRDGGEVLFLLGIVFGGHRT
jgi:hypothetical protein